MVCSFLATRPLAVFDKRVLYCFCSQRCVQDTFVPMTKFNVLNFSPQAFSSKESAEGEVSSCDH